MRNALAHVPTKQRPAVIAMIKTIFAQESAAEAHAQWKSVADALEDGRHRTGRRTLPARSGRLACWSR